MINNRIRVTFLTVVMLAVASFVGCGSKESSSNENSSTYEADTKTETKKELPKTKKPDFNMNDIEWSIDQQIVGGERMTALAYTNNSPYGIAEFKISFIEKEEITEEQREQFFSDIVTMFGDDTVTEEDLNKAKMMDITMNARSERYVASGESCPAANVYYYDGYYYMRSLDHYQLVRPDIATIKVVSDGLIYTVYHDFVSDKCTFEDDTEVAYQWGEVSSLRDLISKPEVEVLKLNFDRSDVYSFYAYGITNEMYKAYIEDCKQRGFDVDISGFDTSYYAYDGMGNRISISFNSEIQEMRVNIDESNNKKEDLSNEQAKSTVETSSPEPTKTESEEKLVDGMRQSFKEAMDAYEDFYDEYCEFMKKYNKDSSNTELLEEYFDMLEKEVEVAEAFEKWDEDELNDAELKYYIKVTGRVTQKMLDAME
ncbi:MAG: hypothetical protein HUJ70_06485 [Pseudobutyrivibrio sp.]|nr:hypothetical protein [Pseudobutyrivibrio sp.]